MKNLMTDEIWIWAASKIDNYYYGEHNFIVTIIDRALCILKLLFGYFLCSNITAIYTKITIVCAPIFILMICNPIHPYYGLTERFVDSCCGNMGGIDQNARVNIYRAFPWIGIYLYALLVNGHRKQSHVILAFVCLIIIFYCLYLSAIFIWSALLFYKSLPKGLDENFYGFIAGLEFATLLFIRTRSSIKWFPVLTLLPIMCFLYYVQYTAYGFYNIALYLMMTVCLSILGYHLAAFEVPALLWNPFYHYTPSVDSPRTLYNPLFSLSWYHDLPQLWTMFYPLFGRSTFTEPQLAMIDRNNLLLTQTLEMAASGGQNLHQEMGDPPEAVPNPNQQPQQQRDNEPHSPNSAMQSQHSAGSPLQGNRGLEVGAINLGGNTGANATTHNLIEENVDDLELGGDDSHISKQLTVLCLI